jgi:hypothetical protein
LVTFAPVIAEKIATAFDSTAAAEDRNYALQYLRDYGFESWEYLEPVLNSIIES